jgi:hypothetical protein
MVITIHCANPRCEAYKKPVKFYLRRSRTCLVCGSLMVDGERSNARQNALTLRYWNRGPSTP